MILVDYSQVFIGSFMQVVKNNKPDEELVRHIVLNSIRNYNKNYSKEYGDIVLCCDHQNIWRKQYFPQYKVPRKLKRKKDEENYILGNVSFSWNDLFKSLNKVREEIKEYLPYTVMQVEECEADDIIAVLCKYLQTEETIPSGKVSFWEEKQQVMIISSDKDFIQLHSYDNVKQYSPLTKKYLTHENPKEYLYEHILRGDKSDGIPNILSDDKCFVEERRQIPLTKKRLSQINIEELSESNNYRYSRNKTLIDLSNIPDHIEKFIIDEWKTTNQCINRKQLFNYFVKYKLKNLIEVIEEF
jgi:hypothetical protein